MEAHMGSSEADYMDSEQRVDQYDDQQKDEWAKYAKENSGPTQVGENLKQTLVTQVEDLIAAEEEVERLKDELATAEKTVKNIREMQIPQTFEDMGLDDTSVIKVNGISVSIKSKTFASPLAANREKVYDWLEEHGHGGLIKRKALFSVGRDNEAKAKAWIKRIKAFEGHYERKVEPATLRSFVTQQLKEGAEIPMDLFNAYTKREAAIKVPSE